MNRKIGVPHGLNLSETLFKIVIELCHDVGNRLAPHQSSSRVEMVPQGLVRLEESFPDAQPQDWVLPGRGGRPMEMGWFMEKYVRPVAEKLGISSIHWHAFRHLSNSIVLDEGVDVKTQMDRLGHVEERVNMIYTHFGNEAQRSAAEVVWQKLKTAARQQEEAKAVSLKVSEGRREVDEYALSY